MSENWTHAICNACWKEIEPDREAARVSDMIRKIEMCCWCGTPTASGIYRRENPQNPDLKFCAGNKHFVEGNER